jgi:hypothetical protein
MRRCLLGLLVSRGLGLVLAPPRCHLLHCYRGAVSYERGTPVGAVSYERSTSVGAISYKRGTPVEIRVDQASALSLRRRAVFSTVRVQIP